MTQVHQICDYLDQLAPRELAESWDNTGLLVGDPAAPVERVMTCLTITPESTVEAVESQAQLIVTHHPLPFRPLARITTESTAGHLLWQLIRAGIAVYSAHTRFDSTGSGINQQIGKRLGLQDLRPLAPLVGQTAVGAGRIGEFSTPLTLRSFAGVLKSQFGLAALEVAGSLEAFVRRVAIACGSGGSLLEPACHAGCDTFLTGEANFHTALECRARGVILVLLGHYASERFAMEGLAAQLASAFPQLTVWPSRCESDPLTRIE